MTRVSGTALLSLVAAVIVPLVAGFSLKILPSGYSRDTGVMLAIILTSAVVLGTVQTVPLRKFKKEQDRTLQHWIKLGVVAALFTMIWYASLTLFVGELTYRTANEPVQFRTAYQLAGHDKTCGERIRFADSYTRRIIYRCASDVMGPIEVSGAVNIEARRGFFGTVIIRVVVVN